MPNESSGSDSPRGPRGSFAGRPRHRRRHKPRKATAPAADLPVCPVCQKAIRELHAAITHRESGQPAHFDCILQVLREGNELQANEKICYLGKGAFGIVQFRQSAGPARFLIRKRIQYEQSEGFPEWRRSTVRSQPAR